MAFKFIFFSYNILTCLDKSTHNLIYFKVNSQYILIYVASLEGNNFKINFAKM